MTWLSNNWASIFVYGWEHLLIAIPAILLSILIAVPVGYWAYRMPRFGEVLVSAMTLTYAIPSLPILIIIPVIFAIPLRSDANMIIALTVYGVALLVRSATDAFGSVDKEPKLAARAMGYSRFRLFTEVELPLATPIIIEGVRVVTVSTISLVTIGALIGVPSLGSLLTDGFQRKITVMIAAGILATMILALILDWLVQLAGRLLAPWHYRGVLA